MAESSSALCICKHLATASVLLAQIRRVYIFANYFSTRRKVNRTLNELGI